MKPKCPICDSDVKLEIGETTGYQEGGRFSIVECQECLVQYADPLRVQGRIYDDIYRQANQVPGYKRYLTYAEEVLKTKMPLEYLAANEDTYYFISEKIRQSATRKCSRILEVGCGLGYLTYALRRDGHEAWGLDISSATVEAARSRYGRWYFCSSIEELPDNRGNFDFIVMTEVIEHLEKPRELLVNLRKRLAPGGRVLLTTPNRNLYKNSVIWHTELPPVHLWWFSELSVHILGRSCGFRVQLFDFTPWNKKVGTGEIQKREMRRDSAPVLDRNGNLNPMVRPERSLLSTSSRAQLRVKALLQGARSGAKERWESPLGSIAINDPSRSGAMGIEMYVGSS